MKELIEKQAIIDALLAKMDTIDDKPDVVLGMAVAAAMINDMPSALEQEPCTVTEFADRCMECGKILGDMIKSCDDCVSRQAVLDCLTATKLKKFDFILQARAEIKKLSSVTPQPREDIESAQVELEGDGYADGKIVYDYGKCPKCGWEFEEGDKDWEEPYCCHCGQKLDWFETQEVEE